MATPVCYRNLAAECRAVESGNHARLAADGTALLVVSESDPGRSRRVTASGAAGAPVMFGCDCPWGEYNSPTHGLAGCRHMATAARRLEREGLIRFDGMLWVATPKDDAANFHPTIPDDPFEGLPKGF